METLTLTMPLHLFSFPVQIVGLIAAIIFAYFLIWRQAKHELYDDREIFDILFIGSLGGLIGGRLVAFFVEFETFTFSISKLLFFHIYPGFNYYGFIAGAMVSAALLLRRRRQQPWKLFDLAAAPLIFGLLTNVLFLLLSRYLAEKKMNYEVLAMGLVFILLYFAIKRLEKLKRHIGYFACYFLVLVPTANLLFSLLKMGYSPDSFYRLIVVSGMMVFGITAWYRLAKRRLKNDSKQIAAFFLLRLFAFFRVIRSTDEAGKVSKGLIFFPYTTTHTFLVLLRGLFREIKLGFLELLYSLGVRK